ncbi:MAG: VOC family protein [Roseovarius sp.]|nr:VOC family protein [Roseovarius sp.]
MPDPDLPPAPSPDAILEAGLYAEDLPAARAFYGGVLGLEEVIHVEGRHVFYRVGGSILLIFNPNATAKGTSDGKLPVPAHGAHGPGHLCFAASRKDMDAWRARLTAAGHPIESAFDWPNGAHSIYFRDPAGNSLEFAEARLWF